MSPLTGNWGQPFRGALEPFLARRDPQDGRYGRHQDSAAQACQSQSAPFRLEYGESHWSPQSLCPGGLTSMEWFTWIQEQQYAYLLNSIRLMLTLLPLQKMTTWALIGGRMNQERACPTKLWTSVSTSFWWSNLKLVSLHSCIILLPHSHGVIAMEDTRPVLPRHERGDGLFGHARSSKVDNQVCEGRYHASHHCLEVKSAMQNRMSQTSISGYLATGWDDPK